MDIITAIDPVEAIGWFASALTIATYSMQSMLPLRVLALLSTLCFLVYGAINQLWPLLAMEATLLPINAWRLWQLLSLRARVAADTADTPADFTIVRRYGTTQRLPAGSLVFRKGDPAEQLYLVGEGRVLIEEIGVEIAAGDIFGEIAFFTDEGTRTATARCTADTVLHALDRTRFMRLQFEDPSFGLAVMRTVTRRLVTNDADRRRAQARPS